MKTNDIYERADKVAEYLTKQYVREFNKSRNMIGMDSMNVIKATKKLYEWLDKITREAYFMMARIIYAEYADDESEFEEAWLVGILDGYDPVTKYVFTNEWERKRSYLAEGVISSPTDADKRDEIDKALRFLTRQGTQYAITVADEAQKKAFKKNGVKRVRWDAENDTRVCEICHSRHNHIYSINEVPPKPHYGCRCHIVPVSEVK